MLGQARTGQEEKLLTRVLGPADALHTASLQRGRHDGTRNGGLRKAPWKASRHQMGQPILPRHRLLIDAIEHRMRTGHPPNPARLTNASPQHELHAPAI